MRANTWHVIIRQVPFTEPWPAPDLRYFVKLLQPWDAWAMSYPIHG